MSTARAFTHQMVLPLQRTMYEYWRGLCQGGALPSRRDIDPSAIREHLPTVTVTKIERRPDSTRYYHRLVGTAIWELYEDEITGRYMDELPLGDRVAYWHRILGKVATDRRPTAGVTRPGTPYGSHLAQFWIRMPLSENGRDVDHILGFDQLMKMSDVAKVLPQAKETVSA